MYHVLYCVLLWMILHKNDPWFYALVVWRKANVSNTAAKSNIDVFLFSWSRRLVSFCILNIMWAIKRPKQMPPWHLLPVETVPLWKFAVFNKPFLSSFLEWQRSCDSQCRHVWHFFSGLWKYLFTKQYHNTFFWRINHFRGRLSCALSLLATF